MKILKQIQADVSKQKADMKEMEQNIKESINNNIDEKFNLMENRTKQLEHKIEQQQKSIDFLEKQLRKKNLVIFGIEETENNYEGLVDLVIETIHSKMKIACLTGEIENVVRIGKRTGKTRPIIVTLTTMGKKIEIIKKKKILENSGIYIKEDYPLSVLEKRRELQETLKQERENGNFVVLRYDKIVTLNSSGSKSDGNTYSRNKKSNKRVLSTSPESSEIVGNKNILVQEAKQATKKNKTQPKLNSQSITGFLRPSQLNITSSPTTLTDSGVDETPKN